MTRDQKINEIIELLKADEDLLVECAEELDSYNGFLDGDRYYCMEDLPELLYGIDTVELLNMAFFGSDEDSWYENSSFNPNRKYFRFNAYGNLVSSDYINYSDVLDAYFIEELADNRKWVDAIVGEPGLKELFDDLEELGRE